MINWGVGGGVRGWGRKCGQVVVAQTMVDDEMGVSCQVSAQNDGHTDNSATLITADGVSKEVRVPQIPTTQKNTTGADCQLQWSHPFTSPTRPKDNPLPCANPQQISITTAMEHPREWRASTRHASQARQSESTWNALPW